MAASVPTATAIRTTASAMTRRPGLASACRRHTSEDDMWDVAVKYAADWNSVKFSAAVGYTQLTDEGCNAPRHRAKIGTETAPTSSLLVVVARPSRTIGRMQISSRSARLSCTFRQACSSMACIRTSRTTARSGRRRSSMAIHCLIQRQGQVGRQRSQRDRRLVREGRYQEGLDACRRHRALRRVGPV